jgi:hypothetical protein
VSIPFIVSAAPRVIEGVARRASRRERGALWIWERTGSHSVSWCQKKVCVQGYVAGRNVVDA